MDKNDESIDNFPCLQGLRVLVVDNNVDCCDLMKLLLRIYGVEVRTAFLAQEALEILVEWQPDILVSEIVLPEVDGFTLVQKAKTIAAERGKVLPVIVVTTSIDEKMRQIAFLNGFDFWFTKPLNFNDFIAVVVCSASDRFSKIIV